MMTSSGFPTSRPRCAEHGLMLDDAGRCSRCARHDDENARGTFRRVVILAAVAIAVLLVYRVGKIGYELVHAYASAPSAPLVPVTQNGSRVIVYTTGSCPACRMAKGWMGTHEVAYEERRVDSDEGSRRELASLGKGVVVPTFVVDDQVLVGFDAQGVRLTEALKAHGIK